MILRDVDVERLFLQRIDGKFPYAEEAASQLIQEGWRISLNAAFCVLHELCRPPRSADVGKEHLEALVSEWAMGPDHPLKVPVLRAARALITGVPLASQDAVQLMAHIGEYEAQSAALSIAYFSADHDCPEDAAAVEQAEANIRKKWDAAGA